MDYISLTISLVSLTTAFLAIFYAHRQSRVATKDLSLSAYYNAIERLLDIKQSFAEKPDLFLEQLAEMDSIEVVPESMREDPSQFLLFASGLWKLSYIYSVASRHGPLGLSEAERDGLIAEAKLWLSLPGFKEVYLAHTSRFKAHNRDFLEFLGEFYAEERS